MKNILAVVSLAAVVAVAGCASPGAAEDFKWSIECPKSVDKGSEFTFVVTTANPSGQAVNGMRFHYQIMWTGGSANPLRHKGHSGENEKVHARLAPGPATIVVTSENREGLETKVLESSFEVK